MSYQASLCVEVEIGSGIITLSLVNNSENKAEL